MVHRASLHTSVEILLSGSKMKSKYFFFLSINAVGDFDVAGGSWELIPAE